MSQSAVVPACPPGFDCAFLNSCPQYYVDCPDGYFCDSYQGFPGQGKMDMKYAMYTQMNSDATVTEKNKERYIDKNRAIQVKCLFGFFCSSYDEMEVCPSGHWCSESTVVPNKCDVLSICGEGSGYQINFMAVLIMAVMAIFIFGSSNRLVSRQKRRDQQSHLKDPSAQVESETGVATKYEPPSGKHSSSQRSLVEVSFKDLLFQVAAPVEKGLLHVDSFKAGVVNTRDILPRISGTIPAGKLSVMLGPTACGKSTLLNLLRTGGVGATSGEVSINLVGTSEPGANGAPGASTARALTTRDLSKYVGYVPQDDILDRSLTIRELLAFNTRARLPHVTADAEVDAIVNSVLSDLAIQHVADSIIGGGENKSANISGGQLKRVNIGVELVALSSPGFLLLDEPTAGLDAAIAYDLIQSLETIMIHKGITILSVLQQPRAEIFNKIDGSLFLMDVTGNIVYEGPANEVVDYLLSIGYVKPSNSTAPADFCIDVLNGLADRSDESVAHHISHQATKTLTDSEKNGSGGSSKRHLGHRVVRAGSVSTIIEFNLASAWQQHCLMKNSVENGTGRRSASPASTTSDSSEAPDSLWAQFLSFLRLSALNGQRLLTIRLRNTSSLVTYFAINCIMAIALSSGFSILIAQDSYLGVIVPPTKMDLQAFVPSPLSDYASRNADDFGFTQLLFFMGSTLGCASCLTAVPVFSGQLALIKRERAAGMSVAAYTFGRMVADLLFVVFNAMVYTGTWMLFGHVGHWYNWIASIVCTAFAASGIGYITGAAFRAGDASVYAIMLTFICCVFSGSEPTLADVTKYPVVNWPWYLSFATYTSEATYYTWTQYLDNDGHVADPVQEGADHYGYEVDNGLGRSIGALIALGVGMRVIAGVILYFKAKGK